MLNVSDHSSSSELSGIERDRRFRSQKVRSSLTIWGEASCDDRGFPANLRSWSTLSESESRLAIWHLLRIRMLSEGSLPPPRTLLSFLALTHTGIPTYRGQSNSLWSLNPVALATQENFNENPSSSWYFYHPRRAAYLDAKPNNAHRALAILNNPSTLSRIAPNAQSPPLHVTQNIDELSLRVLNAFPQDVKNDAEQHLIQMHGSMFRTRCTSCHRGRSSCR